MKKIKFIVLLSIVLKSNISVAQFSQFYEHPNSCFGETLRFNYEEASNYEENSLLFLFWEENNLAKSVGTNSLIYTEKKDIIFTLFDETTSFVLSGPDPNNPGGGGFPQQPLPVGSGLFILLGLIVIYCMRKNIAMTKQKHLGDIHFSIKYLFLLRPNK